MINEHAFILRTDDLTIQKYLFYVLFSNLGQRLLQENITGSAQGGLNSTNLKNIKIPFDENKIKQIVKECEKVDSEFKTTRMEIEELKSKISEIFVKFDIKFSEDAAGRGRTYELISKYCDILIGGTPSRKNSAYYGGENLWLSISEMSSNVIYDTKEKSQIWVLKTQMSNLYPKAPPS